MTTKQYLILLDLYLELNKDFWLISYDTRNKFFDILCGRNKPIDGPLTKGKPIE